MKYRNGILEKLAKRPDLSEYNLKLLKIIDRYLEYYDLFHKTNQRMIFHLLYRQRRSNITVQILGNISKSTLDRYIKKYDRMARTLIVADCNFINLKKSLQI